MISKVLGALLALSGAFGLWEYSQANRWEAKYNGLTASYAQAALDAETQAKEKEAADMEALQKQTQGAIEQATYAKNQAQLAEATYSRKLAQLAGKPNLDLPHQCANIALPKDLEPK